MINKLIIKLKNGKLIQYRLFNIPVLNIKKSGNNIVSVCFFKKIYQKNNKPVFYLKCNRADRSDLACIQQWLNIIDVMSADYYIICDKKNIKNEIKEKLVFPDANIKFIKSDKRFLKKSLKNMCVPYWENAGFAHMTPFVHAYKNNIEKFWSIDADDTIMFEDPVKISDYLKQTALYADENNIEVFGYDVLNSMLNGKHWCFGVTYVSKDNKNIVQYLRKVNNKKWLNYFKKWIFNVNMDLFFTYLRDNKIFDIRSFSFENMYYSHFGVGFDIFRNVHIVKEKKIIYPFYKKILPDTDNPWELPVNRDTIIFDYNISENESKNQLLKFYNDHIIFEHKNLWECL